MRCIPVTVLRFDGGRRRRMHPVYRLARISLALLVAACAGKESIAPASLASITLSPSSVSIGVGQTQTLVAVGRDQTGAEVSGLSFTWTSSNTSVATVSGGLATGIAQGTTNITASSGGLTSNTVVLTVGITGSTGAGTSVVIDKASVLLPGTGQSARLTARILDAQGVAVAGTVVWTSSAPDKISVDATGRLTAVAIGSAQIFAEAAGLRSAPTLAFVAQPQPGALLVTDAHVVSIGSPIAGTPPGAATQYEVTLNGMSAPTAGTVILAAETAPVAGKVISTRQGAAGIVVTVALAPIYELFSAYNIALKLDLSKFSAEAIPESGARRTPNVVWNARRRPAPGAPAAPQAADELQPFRAFYCEANIEPQLVSASIQLSLENKLTLELEDRPGYSKHALTGSVAFVGSAGLKLKAGFKATGDCKAQAQLKLPVFGMFSAIAMPAVRVGVGAGLEGEILLVQGELGVEGKVGANFAVGWECGGAQLACRALDDISELNELKTKSEIPSKNDMQVKISGQFYVLAGLDISLLFGAANAEILEARVGPEQSFDLAFEEDQAARGEYAASYDLKLKGVVEPGSALKKAIKQAINDDATGVSFKAEFTKPLSESPNGNLAISKARVRPDEAVDFTVDLTPSTVAYFLLGYNVTGVELYRKRENESEFTRWKSMTQIASNRATYRWIPVEADAGKYEFAAFVNTQLVTPLLEVAPSSIRPLEVSCFSGGARLVRQTAAATVCADQWVGTSTINIGGNITRANITWIYDPSISGEGFIAYKASGNFTLSLATNSAGCTLTPSPQSFTIAENSPDVRLRIYNEGIYVLDGVQRIEFTVTSSCPNMGGPVKNFPARIVDGTGPYAAGMVSLTGQFKVGDVTSTWDFRRP